MSAGDIDDHLGSQETLNRLLVEKPEFASYCASAWSLPPIRTFFIPFGAGISDAGNRVYISYDLQTMVDNVECANALVRHETTEWALRQFCSIGLDYSSDPSGHRLANLVEHDRVCSLLDRPEAWDRYCEIIDPQVILDERQSFADKSVPKDLALYPYPPDIADRLRQAMWNVRSEQEWGKLRG